MKILFVDCDGCINNARTPNTDGWPVDPLCAFLVGKIVLATDCKIVLSSSWRHSVEARGIFRRKVHPFIDITNNSVLSRGHEISAWLLANPDVTRYAILDDDADMLPEQPLFQTTFAEGLTEEITERVIKHLCST
jgi:hypothetical protein